MLHAIIMAGGAGTRLWPESRQNQPKQLLTFGDTRSLLQKTLDRLQPTVSLENIRIVTGKHLAQAIRQQTPELPEDAVVVEPCARNTAACIALAALLCLEKDPEATLVVLPSDQYITTNAQFQATLQEAAQLVEQAPETLVTLGIQPTYPAESFGYIERGEALESQGTSIPAFHVCKFREKPSRDVAAEYIDTGRFFWNAGIFVWKAAAVLRNLQTYAPNVYAPVEEIQTALRQYGSASPLFVEVLERVFPQIPSISIDYAVMEPVAGAGNVVVVSAPFAWDDVGSWRAMERVFPQDANQNTVLINGSQGAEVLMLQSHGCIVRCSDAAKKVVATYGLENLGVVITSEAVLIFDKQCEESVREVTKKLKELGREELL